MAEAGASVLAFVLLAIKSSKVVYEVASSMKDGSRHVAKVRQDVQSLQWTLQSLERCRVIRETPDEATANRIKRCANDMAQFAENLTSLTNSGTGSRTWKPWRSIRIFFNEKNLKEIADAVAGHTYALNLQLSILESAALVDVRDQLSVVERQGVSTQRTIRESRSAVTEQQTLTTESLRQEISEVADGTRSIQIQLQAVQTGSTAQGDQMIHMLNQISLHGPEQVHRHSLAHGAGARVVEVQGDDSQCLQETSPDEISPHTELAENAEAILSAIHDKLGVLDLNEAKKVLDFLISFLDAMTSERFLESAAGSALPYRYWCETCTNRDLENLQKNLMAVKGTVLIGQRISVNEPGRTPSRSSTPGHMQIYGETRSLDVGSGVVSITSFVRSKTAPAAPEQDDEETARVTQIRFVPRSDLPRLGLQMTARRYYYGRGNSPSFSTDIPRISAINVLPAGSRVFSLVSQGLMEEFQQMLRLGLASLRDHDEHGASLLFYANKQPEMCRFLLQNGADVDHVATTGNPYYPYISTAMNAEVNDNEAYDDELGPILECRKMLLESGGDPSIPIIDSEGQDEQFGGSVAFNTFDFGVPDAISILLDTQCFVTVESFVYPHWKLTPLLALCDCGRFSADGFAILIGRGSNINARDLYGQTCLHLCLIANWCQGEGWLHLERLRNALTYLLEHGADPLAVSDHNRSVSELAYMNVGYPRHCSLKGDMWDAVLAGCGFDVAEFRQQLPDLPRRARYHPEYYTRQHFENLWSGMEHLCPYYDDMESEDWTSDDEYADVEDVGNDTDSSMSESIGEDVG